MTKVLRCPDGHEWDATADDLAPAATLAPCPVCGGAAVLLSETIPLPPASDLQQTDTFLPSRDLPETPKTATRPRDLSVPGYEVLSVLGRGGMGVVYQALQTKLKRIVALKMILAGGHAGAAELDRFRTEAEAIARLQHPHIVQIYEVGEYEGRPFFSLEYCAGGSLQKKLGGTPLPPAEAAALVEKLARAMHVAHEKGVIHRDLKPANVLLSDEPGGVSPGRVATPGADATGLAGHVPKITDFGLAKKLDEAGQTQSGAIMGTPSYMAPEQAAGKSKELGPACDVYALGAILYECLTGRPPFRAATALDTILQVTNDEPVLPSQLQSKTPRDLETICLTCLRKEPGKRYSSAAMLADDLARFQRGEPIAARPAGWLERGWRWCRRNPALAAALAGVAASLLVGTVVAVVLALQANEARRTAERRAETEAAAKETARLQREAAVAARNELEKSNEQLLTSVARSLVRPMASQARSMQGLPPLSVPELDALDELEQTKEEKLRLRLVEEALRTPLTTRQLRHRAGFILQAAVGLDERRRAAVERLLAERLATPETPAGQKVDAALCLAALGDVEAATARLAVQAITRALAPAVKKKEFQMDAEEVRTLAEGLVSLAARLGPQEASANRVQAARFLAQAQSQSTYMTRNSLALGLMAVAARLQAKEAREAADLVVENMRRIEERDLVGEALTLYSYVKCLDALAAQMGPRDAAVVCSRAATFLLKAMDRAQGASGTESLARSLALLAARMSHAEAVAACSQAASALARIVGQTTVATELYSLAKGLVEVRAWVSPETARETSAVLLRHMRQTKDPYALRVLADGLAALKVGTDPNVAREAAALLIGALGQSKDRFALRALADGLDGVGTGLGPTEARETVAAIVQAMDQTNDAHALAALARALVAVTALLEGERTACMRAATVLTQALEQTKDLTDLRQLAEGLALVAARLTPEEAAGFCTRATATLTQALARTKHPDELRAAAEGLVSLAAWLGPRESQEAAAIFMRLIDRTKDPFLLQSLAKGLMAVTRSEPGQAAASRLRAAGVFLRAMDQPQHDLFSTLPQALSRGLVLVLGLGPAPRDPRRATGASSVLGLGTSAPLVPLTPVLLKAALEPPPGSLLPAEALVELLKQSHCVGGARRLVLDALGAHYQRPFVEQWDFVRFATERQLGFDFTSPPTRPPPPAASR